MSNEQRLKVDKLELAETRIRAAIDEALVAQYAERMEAGDTFPPVVVFHEGDKHYVADGQHRVYAARRAGRTQIEADLRPGDLAEAVWYALGANAKHGARLRRGDVARAIRTALERFPDKTQGQIADQVGCSRVYVNRVANESERVNSLHRMFRPALEAIRHARTLLPEFRLDSFPQSTEWDDYERACEQAGKVTRECLAEVRQLGEEADRLSQSEPYEALRLYVAIAKGAGAIVDAWTEHRLWHQRAAGAILNSLPPWARKAIEAGHLDTLCDLLNARIAELATDEAQAVLAGGGQRE